MFGYDARVHEIYSNVCAEDLQRIGTLPYAERMSYFGTLTSQKAVHIFYRTWVDHLLAASEHGWAWMLQDGGNPYLFHAPGVEIKANFASAEVVAISALEDTTCISSKRGIRAE